MRLILRLKMMKAFMALVKDPSQTDQVFAMSDAAIAQQGPLLHKAIETALAQDGFKDLYEANYNPVIPSLKELETYPEGTFGREFARHMLSNGLEVDFFPKKPSDTMQNYLINRGRGSHDFWHVLTGYDTSVPSEIGLQGFSLAQIRSGFSALLIAGGLLHALTQKPELFDEMVDKLFEGYQIGKNSKSLIGVPLESMFNENLNDLRAKLNIRAAVA